MPLRRAAAAAKQLVERGQAEQLRQGLPADRLKNQLPSRAMPPASGSARGGVTLSDADPVANGAVDPGSSSAASRGDHVHPSGGGGSLDVTDGVTTVTSAASLAFPAGTVSDLGGGAAAYTPAGGAGTDLLTLIADALANGTDDPIDQKIVSGSYIILLHFRGNTVSGWSSPSTALHTVTSGKRFVVVAAYGSSGIVNDHGNRQARLRNTTDSTDVVADTYFASPYGPFTIPYQGDGATATTFASAAATKAIELQLWNTDTTKRAMGAIVIGKEI